MSVMMTISITFNCSGSAIISLKKESKLQSFLEIIPVAMCTITAVKFKSSVVRSG